MVTTSTGSALGINGHMTDFSCHSDQSMPRLAVNDEPSTHTHPQGNHAEVVYVTACAYPFLAQCRAVCIVFEKNRHPKAAFQVTPYRIVVPSRQVGGRVQRTTGKIDDPWNTDSN